jgi:hypothetical protein
VAGLHWHCSHFVALAEQSQRDRGETSGTNCGKALHRRSKLIDDLCKNIKAKPAKSQRLHLLRLARKRKARWTRSTNFIKANGGVNEFAWRLAAQEQD